jgi:hypothetical protein
MNIRDEGNRAPSISSSRTAGLDQGLSVSGLTNLGLTELSPTEWRVVDALRPADDAGRVLGFIQRVGGAYEVTSLLRLRERTYFSSFERAAASLDPRRELA